MYENGSRKGLGESRNPDGSVYRGEWSGGAIHGWGEYITPNGVSFKGRWDHDKLNGKSLGDLDREARNNKEELARQRKAKEEEERQEKERQDRERQDREKEEFLVRPSVFVSPSVAIASIEVEDLPHAEVDPIVLRVKSQTTTFLQNRYVEDYLSISMSIYYPYLSIYLSI